MAGALVPVVQFLAGKALSTYSTTERAFLGVYITVSKGLLSLRQSKQDDVRLLTWRLRCSDRLKLSPQ